MLLERVDELTLRLHDFRGNPAAMLAGVLARIDRLKEALRHAPTRSRPGRPTLPAGDERAEREREFAQVYRAHDRMLREQGALDAGRPRAAVAARCCERPHVRARVAARHRHVLVDDVQDLAYAHTRLVLALVAEHRGLTAAGDPDQAIQRARGAAGKNLRDIAERAARGAHRPSRAVAALRRARSSTPRTPSSPPNPGRLPAPAEAQRAGRVRFWRCASERAQAQAAAAEIERLLRAGADPGRHRRARALGAPGGPGGRRRARRARRPLPAGGRARRCFDRAEVKDVLAWLRLLVDPGDAGAVVRALSRPPVELRAVDLARSSRSPAAASSTWSPRSPPRPSRRRSRRRRASGSSAS